MEEKTRWEENEYGESWVHLMNGLFREIADVMGVAFPDGMGSLVNQFMECHKLTTQFTTNETILINLFNSTNNYTHSQNLNIKSPNFTLTSLSHWKVLTVLISQP